MTAKSNWNVLPMKSCGGYEQSKIEEDRYVSHCKELSMGDEQPIDAAKGLYPWIPETEQEFCNHLIKGPNAPASCTIGGCWNLWKCCRCGEVTRAGACSKGCSWQEWGWICIFHHRGPELTEREYRRRIELCDVICEKIKQHAEAGTMPVAPRSYQQGLHDTPPSAPWALSPSPATTSNCSLL